VNDDYFSLAGQVTLFVGLLQGDAIRTGWQEMSKENPAGDIYYKDPGHHTDISGLALSKLRVLDLLLSFLAGIAGYCNSFPFSWVDSPSSSPFRGFLFWCDPWAFGLSG